MTVHHCEETVYAVIPTFNRLDTTRRCISNLVAQTYTRIVIVVSDGGSTDGTPEAIRQEFPSVRMLLANQELWWAGAMARGIEWVMTNGAQANDYVLMMNDDTEFDADLVEKLVNASKAMDAAVAAITVDSENPERVVDGGTYLDWENYRYRTMTHIHPGEIGRDDVDVLPGRAALVPVHMIAQAGNVAADAFPHYIADYEFFHRLKQMGFRLAVSYQACIRSHVRMTGLRIDEGRQYSVGAYFAILSSRRSMHNAFDHYRFIMRCGPRGKRVLIVARVAVRMFFNAFKRICGNRALGKKAL